MFTSIAPEYHVKLLKMVHQVHPSMEDYVVTKPTTIYPLLKDQPNMGIDKLNEYFSTIEEENPGYREIQPTAEQMAFRVDEKELPPMPTLDQPIGFDDLNYVMDNYDYDPDDEVVNNYDEYMADRHIKLKIAEFRRKHGRKP